MILKCKVIRGGVGVGLVKIDFQLSKSKCVRSNEQVKPHTRTTAGIHQHIVPISHTHTYAHALTDHSPTPLYSGGRLIEGYNWGAADEWLIVVVCVNACVCMYMCV